MLSLCWGMRVTLNKERLAILWFLYWAYEDDVLCKIRSHISHLRETSKAGESFFHAQDPTVGPVHFGGTPSRTNLMPALEAEQWSLRKTGLVKSLTQVLRTKDRISIGCCFASLFSLHGTCLACLQHAQVANFLISRKCSQGMERAPRMYLPSGPPQTHLGALILGSHQLWHQYCSRSYFIIREQ